MVPLPCGSPNLKTHWFLRQKWVKFLAPFLPVEVWMNQPLFSWVTLPGRLLYWLFLANAPEAPVWSLQDPPVLSTSVLRRSHSCSVSSRDFVPLASWRSPPLTVLFFLFFSFSGGRGLEVSEIKFTDKIARQQAGENYKLGMKDLFAFSSRYLERRKKKHRQGDAATLLDASVLSVVLVIAYLDACWCLWRSRCSPLSIPLLCLLKPLAQMEMNSALTLLYRDQCKWIFKRAHENSLNACCVLCFGCSFSFNGWTAEHMTLKASSSFGYSLAF